MHLAPNEVFLDNDIIVIKVVGDQTTDSVAAMGKALYNLIAERRAVNKRVLVLDVLLDMKKVPPEARDEVVKIAKTAKYDKAAMLGRGTVLRLGANLLLRAVGKGSKARYFEDYEAALAWLRR